MRNLRFSSGSLSPVPEDLPHRLRRYKADTGLTSGQIAGLVGVDRRGIPVSSHSISNLTKNDGNKVQRRTGTLLLKRIEAILASHEASLVDKPTPPVHNNNTETVRPRLKKEIWEESLSRIADIYDILEERDRILLLDLAERLGEDQKATATYERLEEELEKLLVSAAQIESEVRDCRA